MAFAFLFLVLPVSVKGKEGLKHPLKPFLWKVEGQGLTKPAYLFGTIHVAAPSVTTLHPAAQKAFDAADYFYAEVDMSPESQMGAMALMIRNDGKTLSQSIGANLTKKLDMELKAINPMLSSVPFQSMKTWLVATLPSLLPDQLEGKKPLDLQLWEAAIAANKETVGLESIETQLKGFNKLTEAEQIDFMKASIKQLEKDRKAKSSLKDRLTNAYLTGDEKKVLEKLHASFIEMKKGSNPALGQKLWDAILVARDETISHAILKALQAEPNSSHFFAVGTAHYCTETSILFHLKKAGYIITRIEK